MDATGFDYRERLPLERIDRVTFFKRDELTTDLICCDVAAADQTWFFHEDLSGRDALLRHLEQLPGFRADWYAAVAQPPFAACETVAYERVGQGCATDKRAAIDF
jgi:hypothetical protein